jgi:hypothetical protein
MGWRGDHASLIDQLDALVGADAAAYTIDGYGAVANPAAPCRLRNVMHQLAELLFERDGRYPAWWRAVGAEP